MERWVVWVTLPKVGDIVYYEYYEGPIRLLKKYGTCSRISCECAYCKDWTTYKPGTTGWTNRYTNISFATFMPFNRLHIFQYFYRTIFEDFAHWCTYIHIEDISKPIHQLKLIG